MKCWLFQVMHDWSRHSWGAMVKERLAAQGYSEGTLRERANIFGKRYGERGEGFIEVHHVRPIAARGRATPIYPKRDMIVVCSNCHRMIHKRRDDVWSAARLKRHVKR